MKHPYSKLLLTSTLSLALTAGLQSTFSRTPMREAAHEKASAAAAKHKQDLESRHKHEMEEKKKQDLKNRTPGVDARQEHQKDRIQQGVKSGQLTKEETEKLHSEAKGIREEEKEYKSDGVVTKDERKDLHQDLNVLSKEIYSEKHDSETQPGVIPAHAGSPGIHDPVLNQRQDNQQDRIFQGVKSGELTKGEAISIEQKEARLAYLERKMKSDGTLTAEERARLEKYASKLSADIYKEKHDGQNRDK